MKKYLLCKMLAIGIIILFVGTCILPNVSSIVLKENTQSYPHLGYNGSWKYPDSIYCKITNPFDLIAPENQNYKTAYSYKDFSIMSTGPKIVKKPSRTITNGNTLYVGGSGPGNYTSISAAENDANDGDTIFVYDDSSPYYHQYGIWITKSINLIGENRRQQLLMAEDQPSLPHPFLRS